MIDVFTAKDGAIEFHKEGRCIYDLAASEIKGAGVEVWADHLNRKSWFSPDVKKEFLRQALMTVSDGREE